MRDGVRANRTLRRGTGGWGGEMGEGWKDWGCRKGGKASLWEGRGKSGDGVGGSSSSVSLQLGGVDYFSSPRRRS